MKQNSLTCRIQLSCIIIIYLLLFLAALGASGYLLRDIMVVKPVILIDLLKYMLLCVLFLVLFVNGIKALTLQDEHILKLASSVKNFKWLFVIALILSLTVKFGLIKGAGDSRIDISYLQIGLLITASVFSSWSYEAMVTCVDIPADEI